MHFMNLFMFEVDASLCVFLFGIYVEYLYFMCMFAGTIDECLCFCLESIEITISDAH